MLIWIATGMIPFLEIYGRPADSSASSVPQPEKWICPPCIPIHDDGQSATTDSYVYEVQTSIVDPDPVGSASFS
jgi:hypothetical protein